MLLAKLPGLNGVSFNYVDGIVLAWLIIGVLVGRKKGMTQTLLPTLQWLAIVILAGLFYSALSMLIFKNAAGAFSLLWANVTGYVIIGFGINVLFLSIKKGVNEKLTGSDYFGRAEYYFGMICGLLCFACMFLALVALMNSRVYSDAELADDVKVQKKNFEDIRFPTYMSIQHAVLKESFTGQLIRGHLSKLLIASVTETAPPPTAAKKTEDTINIIIGTPKK